MRRKSVLCPIDDFANLCKSAYDVHDCCSNLLDLSAYNTFYCMQE